MPPTRRRRHSSPSSDEVFDDEDASCSNNSSVDEEDSASESPAAEVTPAARLAAAGLFHLEALHLIICTTCKIAFGPRHAASHAGRNHSKDTTGLQQVLNTLNFCNPSAAELVALPASTPHLARAPPRRDQAPCFVISRNPLRVAPIEQSAIASAPINSATAIYYQQRYQELRAHVNASVAPSGSKLWSKILAVTHWHKRLGLEKFDAQESEEEKCEDAEADGFARLKALHSLLAKPKKPSSGSHAGAREEYNCFVLIQDGVTQMYSALLNVVKDRANLISMSLQHDELNLSTHGNNAQEPLFIRKATLDRYAGLWASMIFVLYKTYTHHEARINREEEHEEQENHPLLPESFDEFPYKEKDLEFYLEGISSELTGMLDRETRDAASLQASMGRLKNHLMHLSISLVEWPFNSSARERASCSHLHACSASTAAAVQTLTTSSASAPRLNTIPRRLL